MPPATGVSQLELAPGLGTTSSSLPTGAGHCTARGSGAERALGKVATAS